MPRVLPQRTRILRTQTRQRDRIIERAERAFVGVWRDLERQAAEILEEWIRTNAEPEPVVLDAGLGRDWVHARIARLFTDPKDWRQLFGRIASQLDEDVLGVLVRTVPRIDRAALIPSGRAEQFAQSNARLITGMSEMLQTRVAEFFQRTETGGLHVQALTEQLNARFAIGENRARLWARDQTLKLHGEITRERHKQAGIDRYTWTSSNDERVRTIHAELDGTIQRYDDPPIISEDGRRGHPGDDYQCRCTPMPIL